ncbi:MAG: hypothetical protein J6S21_02635, partial [Victivallales bacterium]|nr:hypothetical protein [Victivallales bacterium]
MRFEHTGKAYQLVIRDGTDLQDALVLDEALWVAMSAPIKAYTGDPKFLAYVDTFHDGSITSSELKDAIRWLLDVYPKKEQISDCFGGKLNLGDINEASSNGKAIKRSASYILRDLGFGDSQEIDLATVNKFQGILTSRPLNGDGVITVTAATVVSDQSKVALMTECIKDGAAATGGTKDLDGTQGVTLDQFKAFLAAIPEYLSWLKEGEIPEGAERTDIMTFGADTPALVALLDANSALIDGAFKLDELQGFDQRLAGQVLENDGRPGVLDPTKWPGLESHLKNMPLMQPHKLGGIPLNDASYINPIYRGWLQEVTAKLIRPVLGDDVTMLTLEGWGKVKAAVSACRTYLQGKRGAICTGLDPVRLKSSIDEPALTPLAEDLATRDLAVANILKDAAQVEQLLLYLQWLVRLCNNFISFPDLYNPKVPTLFERGRVVIDGRWFNITFPVDSLAAHSAVAASSNVFIIYLEVDTKPAATTLAAPVTIGDKGNLAVGKRGIFFDFAGNEYNAKIVKVIENPVCICEALAAPFGNIGKIVEGKVSKMSTASDATLQKQFTSVVNDPKAAAATAAKNQEAKGGDKSGMLMGIGVAAAALSSAFAFICKTFASMSWLSIIVSVLCVLAVLLLPIMILAIIKLRRQDISSLLEGNGWAINSRMRLSRKQRRFFSRNGYFPTEAQGTPRSRIRK